MPERATAAGWWRNLVHHVLLQKKVRSARKKSGAPMHLFIFYGFLAMLVATTLLGFNTYIPEALKFHKGNYYLLYEATFDTLGLLLVVGLSWAMIRRTTLVARGKALVAAFARKHPESEQLVDDRRAPLSNSSWDLSLLGLLLALSVNGYLLEAARIAANPKPWDKWSWVGHAVAGLLPSLGEGAYKAFWWFHIVLVLGFFAILPRLRIRHSLLAIASTAGSPPTPMGKLRTIPMEEVEETEQVGVKFGKDLTRWNLLSLDACMECGRCTEVCPAWNVGKVLNPKQVVQDIRRAHEAGLEVAPTVTEEALWQCTTC
ncbi:(Fe-S)-binding protein, partial [bacterium]